MGLESDNANKLLLSHMPYRVEINGYGQKFVIYAANPPIQLADGRMLIFEQEYDSYTVSSEYDSET